MLDPNVETDAAALKELSHYASSMGGTNFALAMRNPDGSVKVYPREHQPCQGGEMRKYAITHGDRCTRPSDRRPGDLFNPFPDGIVEAVAFHKRDKFMSSGQFIRDSLSEDSPWLRGFNDPSNIIYVEKDGKTVGYIVNDTEVDPTVLVNLAQYQNTCGHYYEKYLDAGFTRKEALILVALNNHGVETIKIHTYNYYFPVSASLDRFFNADPRDLSGGTFRNGFDYNRRDIQDLFKAKDGEVVTNWEQTVYGKGFPRIVQKKIIGYALKPTYTGDLKMLPLHYYDGSGKPLPEYAEAAPHCTSGYVFKELPADVKQPTWEKYFEICREILDEYYTREPIFHDAVETIETETSTPQPEEVQHDEAIPAGV